MIHLVWSSSKPRFSYWCRFQVILLRLLSYFPTAFFSFGFPAIFVFQVFSYSFVFSWLLSFLSVLFFNLLLFLRWTCSSVLVNFNRCRFKFLSPLCFFFPCHSVECRFGLCSFPFMSFLVKVYICYLLLSLSRMCLVKFVVSSCFRRFFIVVIAISFCHLFIRCMYSRLYKLVSFTVDLSSLIIPKKETAQFPRKRKKISSTKTRMVMNGNGMDNRRFEHKKYNNIYCHMSGVTYKNINMRGRIFVLDEDFEDLE